MVDYKVNGTEFLIDPTIGNWVPRNVFGVTGHGHPIYSGVRVYEIQWSVLTPEQFNQLQTWFNQVSITGTAVVTLPQYGAATYTFYDYSGCVLQEPEMIRYFSEHQLDVRMLVTNIYTE